MDHLARKINKSKWEPLESMQPEAVGADALTACLRTTGNDLSVWDCHNNELDVAEVVLALAANFQRLDKLWVVVISRTDVESSGITIKATKGQTHVADLRLRHRDLASLDIERLARVAHLVAKSARTDGTWYFFGKPDVKELLSTAISAGRLNRADLAPDLSKAIL